MVKDYFIKFFNVIKEQIIILLVGLSKFRQLLYREMRIDFKVFHLQLTPIFTILLVWVPYQIQVCHR